MSMKVTIRDKQAILDLRPPEVEKYLRAKNWQLKKVIPNMGYLFVHPDQAGNETEIFLPTNAQLGDYLHRLSDVVSALEHVERRSQLDVYCDLNPRAADWLPTLASAPVNGQPTAMAK